MDDLRKLLKASNYSEKGITLYENKVGVGEIENYNAHSIYTGPCGDTMEFFLKIKDNIIIDAKFRAIGCAASFMAGSAVTEIIKDKDIEYAKKIVEGDMENLDEIIDFLEGLPPNKVHCACLAKRALKKALMSYK